MATRKLKKDFDKEKMYSKIMPSMLSSRHSEAGEAPADGEAGGAVAGGYVVRNFMEDIVSERLVRTIEMLHACDCERCQKDMMALALNDLQPLYMVVEPEAVRETLQAVRADHEVKVTAALIKAIQAIKGSPNH